MIDLTTLEKCGKFKQFKDLITVLRRERGSPLALAEGGTSLPAVLTAVNIVVAAALELLNVMY